VLQAGVRGFLGRKAISNTNLEEAQRRRLLAASEAGAGGALTLDAHGHQFGIKVIFPAGCVTPGAAEKWRAHGSDSAPPPTVFRLYFSSTVMLCVCVLQVGARRDGHRHTG
jgi:hypothetical protein